MRLTDFDQLASIFARWTGRFEQLSAGRFEGSFQVVQGSNLRIVTVDGNQSILARGHGPPNLFSIYPVSQDNADGLWHERRLEPGRFVVHGPDAETNHRSARFCRMTGLSLPFDRLIHFARLVRNADIAVGPRSWNALTAPPDRVQTLNREMRRLLAFGAAGPKLVITAEANQIEQDCLLALVDIIFPAGADCRRADLPLPARTTLARQAEELMRAHLYEPLGEIDLCAELGVSDRTLRLAFRERFGLGPMIYYKVLRLNLVRATLKGGWVTSVAATAQSLGFKHLGNFAADYRRLFGERPSETLTRSLTIRAVPALCPFKS